MNLVILSIFNSFFSPDISATEVSEKFFFDLNNSKNIRLFSDAWKPSYQNPNLNPKIYKFSSLFLNF